MHVLLKITSRLILTLLQLVFVFFTYQCLGRLPPPWSQFAPPPYTAWSACLSSAFPPALLNMAVRRIFLKCKSDPVTVRLKNLQWPPITPKTKAKLISEALGDLAPHSLPGLTSAATGFFQFLKATWLLLQPHGPPRAF